MRQSQNDLAKQDSLYARVGGEEQINELIDQLYYRLQFDREILLKFSKSDLLKVKELQKKYFLKLFGGNPHIKFVFQELDQAHMRLHITEDQFSRFIHYLEEAMKDMEWDQTNINDALRLIEGQKHFIVNEQATEQLE